MSDMATLRGDVSQVAESTKAMSVEFKDYRQEVSRRLSILHTAVVHSHTINFGVLSALDHLFIMTDMDKGFECLATVSTFENKAMQKLEADSHHFPGTGQETKPASIAGCVEQLNLPLTSGTAQATDPNASSSNAGPSAH